MYNQRWERKVKIMNNSQLSYKWCQIGVAALGLSGIYSIILVVLRTPFLSSIFSDKEIFKTALVIHVDLSVLVWLLSCSVIIWLRTISNQLLDSAISTISYIAFIGILFIVISPWMVSENNPILNNYVPMLDNFWFILGISIFTTSLLMISMISVVSFYFKNTLSQGFNGKKYEGLIGSLIFIISIICLFLSYHKIQHEIIYPMDLYGFYEMLFWSTGHSLQFLYMHTMYAALIFVMGANPRFIKLYYFTIWNNLLMVLSILPIHFIANIDTAEFIEFCTKHMKYAGGISGFFIIISICTEFISTKMKPKFHVGILCSMIIFISGGLIGLAINGTNVTIPAHYHGSIVGISVACMCLVYNLLNVEGQLYKYANMQIIIYMIGQLMHISGLAWSGGYGVLRKNPDMVLSLEAKITMGIMGLGGLVAIIGGLMFVWFYVFVV